MSIFASVSGLAGFLALAPDAARAQREHPNEIGVSFGLVTRSQRDENFNRTRYAGVLGNFGIFYTRSQPRHRHEVGFSGGAGVGWNRYNKSLLFIDLDLRYRFAHRVGDGAVGTWLGFAAGGGPRMFIFRDEDSDHVNWQTLYDLAPTVAVEGRVRGRRGRTHVLAGNLDLPLVGLVSRPPSEVTYNNDLPSLGYGLVRTHHDPRFASLHNVQAVRVGFRWRLALTKRLTQSVGLKSEYMRIAFPAPIASFTHVLYYRLDVGWGRWRAQR